VSGPEFLLLFVVLYALALGLSYAIRLVVSPPHDEPHRKALDLSAYEVAYLAGGPDQAVSAALGALYHRGVISAKGRALELEPGNEELAEHELERELVGAIGRGQTVEQVRKRGALTRAPLRRELQRRGLVLERGRATLVKLVMSTPLVLVLSLGAARLVHGVQAGRPVIFLVVLLAVGAIGALIWLGRSSERTVRGDNALALLSRKNAALKVAVGRRKDGVDPEDVALAIGLFGLGVLATGPFLALHTAMTPPPSTGGSCSSGCGGSSCGGGCGGGGCGGCGG
jgi:uncharacterized protein (TIGR04222 family)